jgi:Asp-tRNA(Asn)/Glu-tRNA(Gln) amidotransferase C subunit
MLRNQALTFAAAVALGVGLSAQAAPQNPSGQQPSQQQPSSQQQQAASSPNQTVASADVSDAELEQFAKSINRVAEINEKLQTGLESAANDEARQKLRQDANEEMAAAVRSNGMDVQRYNAISRSLDKDAELNQRVVAKRRELMAAQQPQQPGASQPDSGSPSR